MTGIHITIRGEYNIVVKRVDGSETETGWFPNLITNQGLDHFGTVGNVSVARFASVGTGTSVPLVSQTSLDSVLGYAAMGPSAVVNPGAPTYATAVTNSYTFAQGSVQGNITEIGTGSSVVAGSLFSRALILDTNGNPTSITITAIDQLIVYYKITYTPPLLDVTGSVVLAGVTYNYTSRIISASSWASGSNGYASYQLACSQPMTYDSTATLVPISVDSLLGRWANDYCAYTTSAYVLGTYYSDWTMTCLPAISNIPGGIKAVTMKNNAGMKFQIVFDNPIPKTNTTQLTLRFRYSWGR